MSKDAKTKNIIGKKKTSVAKATVTPNGRGQVTINGVPIGIIEPQILRSKLAEPVKIAGEGVTGRFDIDVKIQGGGTIAQLYAARQAIARAILSTIPDNGKKNNVRTAFVKYDRHLVVSDTRRAEAKKFGGRGARARR